MLRPMRPPDPREEAARLERLAWRLDAQWAVPGLGWRFGWDFLLGLVPGVGDFSAAAAGLWILWRAARTRPPALLLARMTLHWLLHLLASLVPLLGDLFVLFWKSNQRNLRLFRRWADSPEALAADLGRETAGCLLVTGVLLLLAAAVGAIWAVALLALLARLF